MSEVAEADKPEIRIGDRFRMLKQYGTGSREETWTVLGPDLKKNARMAVTFTVKGFRKTLKRQERIPLYVLERWALNSAGDDTRRVSCGKGKVLNG